MGAHAGQVDIAAVSYAFRQGECIFRRNTQAMHEMIGAAVTPFNRALQAGDLTQRWLGPTTQQGAVMLDRIINEQAQIVAYANDYFLLIMATVPAWLLLLVVRLPRKAISSPVR